MSRSSYLSLAAILASSALVLSACGESESEESTAPATPNAEQAAAAAAASSLVADAEASGKVLFDSAFTPLCTSGSPIANATPYDAAKPGIHPALTFYESAGGTYVSTTLPDSLTLKWEEGKNNLTGIEVVACAKRVNTTMVKECTGYQTDDGKDLGVKIELKNATYEATAMEATTGKILGTETLEATDDTCPMFASEGDTEWVAVPDQELEVFIAKFANIR